MAELKRKYGSKKAAGLGLQHRTNPTTMSPVPATITISDDDSSATETSPAATGRKRAKASPGLFTSDSDEDARRPRKKALKVFRKPCSQKRPVAAVSKPTHASKATSTSRFPPPEDASHSVMSDDDSEYDRDAARPQSSTDGFGTFSTDALLSHAASASPHPQSLRPTSTRHSTPDSIEEDHDDSAAPPRPSAGAEKELAKNPMTITRNISEAEGSPSPPANKRHASSSLVSDSEDDAKPATNASRTEPAAGRIQKRPRPAKNKFFAAAHKYGLDLAKGHEDAFEQADLLHDLFVSLIDGLDCLNGDNDELDKTLDRCLDDLREAARLNYRSILGDVPREVEAKTALEEAEGAMAIHRGNVARYARFTEARKALETINDRVHQNFMWYQDQIRDLREVFEAFGLDWGSIAADGSMGLLED